MSYALVYIEEYVVKPWMEAHTSIQIYIFISASMWQYIFRNTRNGLKSVYFVVYFKYFCVRKVCKEIWFFTFLVEKNFILESKRLLQKLPGKLKSVL